MRILYVVPSLANRGPIIVVRDLVEVMTRHGHQCKVIYFDDKKEINFPCGTQLVKSRHYDFAGFDVVHSHGLRPDIFVRRNRKSSKSTRYVTTLHNYAFRDFRFQYNRLISIVFGTLWMLAVRSHDRIAVLSHDALKYYSRYLPKNRLRVAYNTRRIDNDTLPESETRQLLDFKADDVLIGVNALLTKRKGVDMLINALPDLKNYKLFIVGDGKELNNLKKLAQNNDVLNRVYFAGYKEKAYRYLPYYEIYAIPSRSEGFPISLIEAAIMHKKVVISDIPLFKEIFSEHEVSFFELENIDSLKEAIVNAERDESLSDNIYHRYERDYSPEPFYQNYIAIYRDEI